MSKARRKLFGQVIGDLVPDVPPSQQAQAELHSGHMATRYTASGLSSYGSSSYGSYYSSTWIESGTLAMGHGSHTPRGDGAVVLRNAAGFEMPYVASGEQPEIEVELGGSKFRFLRTPQFKDPYGRPVYTEAAPRPAEHKKAKRALAIGKELSDV